MAKIDDELECVRFERSADSVTIQLALHEQLAVPMTIENAAFFDHASEDLLVEFLKRSARTLLDIYGDARDGRVFADQEVLQRANGVPA